MGMESLAKKLRIKNDIVREALAEFLGTLLLILFGDACVAQAVLSKGSAGNVITIYFGWGLAVVIAVYSCGGISGGHVNPAVSLAMATIGRLSWIKVPVYMIAQYLGAFVASCILYITYVDKLNAFEETKTLATAGIWATYPSSDVTLGNAFIDQVVATALLLLAVMAISDSRNMEVPKQLVPLCVGVIITAIGMCFGLNCGYAINPARDLGPRFFTYTAGWGSQVWSALDYNYWWVPLLGPHIGAVIGVWLYLLLVEFHWPSTTENRTGSENSIDATVEKVQVSKF